MPNHVHISEAKKIAERLKADAVVVLAFQGEHFALASYGATKAKCAATARFVDDLAADITRGLIPPPRF
jgi:uncharacterized protein YbjQ (UPF0145 family)